MIIRRVKFEESTITCYEDMKDNAKCVEIVVVLGV